MVKPTEMRWALELNAANQQEIFQLAPYSVKVGCCGDTIWVTGNSLSPAIEQALKKLPGQLFEIDDSQRLRKFHSQVPTGELPDCGWKPIIEVLSTILPVASMTQPRPTWQTQPTSLNRIPICLTRCSVMEKPAVGMLTTREQLSNWIESAPQIRIAPLRWLVNSGRAALLSGNRLPNIEGQRYWQTGRVWLPIGYTFEPAIALDELQDAANLSPSSIMLWESPHSYSVFLESALQPMTRASVNLWVHGQGADASEFTM